MDFGDILAQYNELCKNKMKSKKGGSNNGIPQGGQAWRNKKTEPVRWNTAHTPEKRPGNKPPENCLSRDNFMDSAILHYGIIDKDAAMEAAAERERLENREVIRHMPCSARIDLHGLTRDDAWHRLDAFITECQRRNLRKVLIVHGKGNHSDNMPVLRDMVKLFIERDTRLGTSGYADRTEGGKGATWVIIREKSL